MRVIQVDRGIPLPRPRRDRRWKYPWLEMEVGDSFLVPDERNVLRMVRVGCSTSRRHGMRFEARQVEGGVRVWRVE